jgi:hypothetical protein
MECELERLEAQLSRYEPVDMLHYAQVAGHLRRIFETLGVERKPRDVTTLGSILRAGIDQQREQDQP